MKKLGPVQPLLLLLTILTEAFVAPEQTHLRIRGASARSWPVLITAAVATSTTSNNSGGEQPRTQPTARLTGYVALEQRGELEAALQSAGFAVVSHEEMIPNDSYSYSYSFSAATGMLKLGVLPASSLTAAEPPAWIPIVKGEEMVMVSNGWSFLDADESEKLSPFDVDAANDEGLYQPKWGQQQHDNGATTVWSALGFDLTPLTKEEVIQDAAKLQNALSRSVLLEGATDPPSAKETHNGYSFAGSVQNVPPGVFACALGGVPLFSTADIAASTGSSGWLSFVRPLSPDHVQHVQPDKESTDQRIEVVCAKTGCHLGHYFGTRDGYCINASALNFIPLDSSHTAVDTPQYAHQLLFAAAPVSYRSLERAQDTPSIRLLRQVMKSCAVPTCKLVVGAGCFWHVEFALRRLVGVVDTVVGYAGGTTQHPTYESVCKGQTGHAEVVRVEFDPAVLDLRILVDCYLAMHDPTKVRAHGKHASGIGQYRSSIFLPSGDTRTEETVRLALRDCQTQLGKELSTQVCVMTSDVSDGWFWSAEERHQRHNERRNECSVQELSTLSASDWLALYGRRAASIIGSSQTINNAVIEI